MEADMKKLYQNYVAAWSARDIEAVVSFLRMIASMRMWPSGLSIVEGVK